jgi:hypothetical protein
MFPKNVPGEEEGTSMRNAMLQQLTGELTRATQQLMDERGAFQVNPKP